MDPSVHAAPLFGAASSSSYVSPAAFGVGNVTEVFPTDPNTPFSVADKSKKVRLHFFPAMHFLF
jgi:beta-arabinofuranosyltransferase